MARGHYSLFSNSRGENGTSDNNDARSDPRRPNLNSRFRGPTLGVHLTSAIYQTKCDAVYQHVYDMYGGARLA